MKSIDRQCSRCGLAATPLNPEEPNALRWKMPAGWILVQNRQGAWARQCPRCADTTRQRHVAYMRSPARMPLIIGTLLDFWKQYPERSLAEVILLAARLRRCEPAALDDLDLASMLEMFTLSDAGRAFEREHGLPPLDPWSLHAHKRVPAPALGDDEPTIEPDDERRAA